MLGQSNADWRSDRREAARSAILGVAWELARESGLAGLSLRDLARRLGMAAPSLYSYFDSKLALYDAMFAAGYRDYLALPVVEATELRPAMRAHARQFVGFCLEDPTRYALLFQRTVPGFTPSAESYALAEEAYRSSVGTLLDHEGVVQEDLDLVTAMFSGLVAQQLANDPGGDRWARLVDDAVDLLAARIEARRTRPPSRRRRGATA